MCSIFLAFELKHFVIYFYINWEYKSSILDAVPSNHKIEFFFIGFQIILFCDSQEHLTAGFSDYHARHVLPGDVILTGTPSGVGKVEPGDVMEVEVDGIGTLINRVVTP